MTLLSESRLSEAASDVVSLSWFIRFRNMSSKLSSLGQTHYIIRTRTRSRTVCDTASVSLTHLFPVTHQAVDQSSVLVQLIHQVVGHVLRT